MPRNSSNAVPEGNGPFPHHDEFGSGKPTMAKLNRMLEEIFDRMDKNFDRMTSCFDRRLDGLIGHTRETNQRFTDLLREARQLRLATEVKVESDTKTRKRTESAAADRVKHGNSSSARVDDRPTRLTKPNLFWLPKNASVTPWSTKALKRQSHIFYPWRCSC